MSIKTVGMFTKALALAGNVFMDKIDRSGVPYINHCIRVAKIFDIKDNLATIALLHDVLEETDITYEYLCNHFNQYIADGVKSLTYDKGVMYIEYINDIPKHLVKVKISDIVDNLCREPSKRQKIKYREAMAILLSKLK